MKSHMKWIVYYGGFFFPENLMKNALAYTIREVFLEQKNKLENLKLLIEDNTNKYNDNSSKLDNISETISELNFRRTINDLEIILKLIEDPYVSEDYLNGYLAEFIGILISISNNEEFFIRIQNKNFRFLTLYFYKIFFDISWNIHKREKLDTLQEVLILYYKYFYQYDYNLSINRFNSLKASWYMKKKGGYETAVDIMGIISPECNEDYYINSIRIDILSRNPRN